MGGLLLDKFFNNAFDELMNEARDTLERALNRVI